MAVRYVIRVVYAVGLLLPALLRAQTSISGFVRDSLSGKPLGGANVQLVPSATPWAAGRTARSDSIGRYRIDSVAPGQYVIGFLHPRLDSLGVDAISRTIDVDPGVRYLRADLALPSGRAFVTTFCGPRADNTGAVFGRVFRADDGAPINGGSVVVRFAQMRIDNGGVRRAQTQVLAPFGEDGRYVACGIPTDAPVIAQARTGSGEMTGKLGLSGEIELTFEPNVPLVHRDLLIAMAPGDSTVASAPRATAAVRSGTARLVGRVITTDGKPLQGARVTVQDTDVSATTDSSGVFRLAGLPSGTRAVEVIAIGFSPVRSSADLRPTRETAITVNIGSKVATLAAVSVKAAPDKAGFLKRRAQGQGYFFDANQIEQRGAMNIGTVLVSAPTLRNNGFDTANPTRPRVSGRGNCTPSAYLDGMQIRDGLGVIDDMLTIRRVGAIEVYASPTDAPAQYRGDGNCAVVLVWTRSYVP